MQNLMKETFRFCAVVSFHTVVFQTVTTVCLQQHTGGTPCLQLLGQNRIHHCYLAQTALSSPPLL